jgi:hypothetical protein
VSRCYFHFEDMAKCMVRQDNNNKEVDSNKLLSSSSITLLLLINHLMLQKVDADPIRTCKNFRDDYLECLHHKKEVGNIFYSLSLMT